MRPVLRVATWNLWWRFGDAPRRLRAIDSVLSELDPDVIGLQEVDQLPPWADARHVARSVDTEGHPLTFGNAIVSRWPIAESTSVTLPGRPGEPAYRTAVFAEIETPHGLLLAIATHLHWQYDASVVRQAQLEAICQRIARWMEDHPRTLAPVLLGDLNAVPESDEVRRLTGLAPPYVDGLIFTDAWAAVGDGPGYTWTRDNPYSANAQWPRRRLDQVMVAWPRPKPTGNPIEAELFGEVAVAIKGDGARGKHQAGLSGSASDGVRSGAGGAGAGGAGADGAGADGAGAGGAGAGGAGAAGAGQGDAGADRPGAIVEVVPSDHLGVIVTLDAREPFPER